MFTEGWLSEPATAGWLFLASLGVLFLLYLAARADASGLDDRYPDIFSAGEPDRREDAPYGLDADEVEDQDRHNPLP